MLGRFELTCLILKCRLRSFSPMFLCTSQILTLVSFKVLLDESMNRRFKILVWLLVAASVIYVVVGAHILGVEAGVNSQLHRIKELEVQIHPNFTGAMHDSYYTHPLRGALAYPSFVLVISWFSILLHFVVRLGKSD